MKSLILVLSIVLGGFLAYGCQHLQNAHDTAHETDAKWRALDSHLHIESDVEQPVE